MHLSTFAPVTAAAKCAHRRFAAPLEPEFGAPVGCRYTFGYVGRRHTRGTALFATARRMLTEVCELALVFEADDALRRGDLFGRCGKADALTVVEPKGDSE